MISNFLYMNGVHDNFGPNFYNFAFYVDLIDCLCVLEIREKVGLIKFIINNEFL